MIATSVYILTAVEWTKFIFGQDSAPDPAQQLMKLPRPPTQLGRRHSFSILHLLWRLQHLGLSAFRILKWFHCLTQCTSATDGQTDGQTDRHTGRQAGKQTHRQKETDR